MALRLTSPKFINGGVFPVTFTCNGKNTSPPLAISGVPKGTKTLVLIFDDPDAAKELAGNGTTFDHWIVYNIPAIDQEIPQNSVPKDGEIGKNSLDSGDYIGPCPPTFEHQYIFRLLALDNKLNLADLPSRAQIEQVATGHIIEETKLISYYEQPNKE